MSNLKAKEARYSFKKEKNRESFVRWTGHRIQQMTTAIALMFAISSAALGYALNSISDRTIPVERIAAWPFVLAIIGFLLSFISGVRVVFNRFISFRETCEIIKLRDRGDNQVLLEERRAQNDKRDERTWFWFQFQTGGFLVGGFLFFVYVCTSNWDRMTAILSRLL